MFERAEPLMSRRRQHYPSEIRRARVTAAGYGAQHACKEWSGTRETRLRSQRQAKAARISRRRSRAAMRRAQLLQRPRAQHPPRRSEPLLPILFFHSSFFISLVRCWLWWLGRRTWKEGRRRSDFHRADKRGTVRRNHPGIVATTATSLITRTRW